MQKASWSGTSRKEMDKAAETLRGILLFFRERKLPVIWIQDVSSMNSPDHPGEAFDLIDGLEPLDRETRVRKRYWNAFNKTELKDVLEAEKVKTVILAGYCAECCVLSTYRGALDLDLEPILLEGALASENPDNRRFVQRISKTASPVMVRRLAGSAAEPEATPDCCPR